MAQRVLADSRDALDRVAQALMERETLTLEEVERIAGGTAARARAGRAGRSSRACTGRLPPLRSRPEGGERPGPKADLG